MDTKHDSRWFARALYLALALFIAAAAQQTFAQSAAINGQIEGTVTDQTGSAVPNAKVVIVSKDTGYTRALQTDSSGFYRFGTLPLGNYSVTVEATGFAKVERSNIAINAGSIATVNVALGVASLSNTVEISSAAPVVEPGRTDIGSTLSSNAVLNLPLASRNTYNFILVQPNVSGHPQNTFGVPRKINANGFTDRLNYQLDGSNNTQSDRAGIRLLPISNTFIGEIQQVNNGFAPEFGNTTGTVFNAITKSGTNGYHGEGAYIFRRQDLNARPSLLRAGQTKPKGFLDSEYVNVGGPVKKDRLFFFSAFEHVSHDVSSLVTATAANIAQLGLSADFGDPVPTVERPYFYLGKVDYQINEKHRLSVRYNYFRNSQPYNGGGGTTLKSATTLFSDRAHAVGVQLISTLTDRSLNEFRFSLPFRDQLNTTFEGSGKGPTLTISGIATFGGPANAGARFVEKTPEFADNFTYNAGTHSWKFGGSLRNVRDDNTAAPSATYTFPSIPAYQAAVAGTNKKGYTTFAQNLGNLTLHYTSLFTTLYAQDAWKARPNLTLSYGVRYDFYKIPAAAKDAPYEPSREFRLDKNNFAPRLGLAWSLGKDQKTVIRANGGIFYDQPQTDVYRRAIIGNGNPVFFNVSTAPTTAFAPSFPDVFTSVPTGFSLPIQTIIGVSKDFRTFYSSNLNLQISRELTPNFGLSAIYLHTKGTGIPVYRNINLVATANKLADGRPIFGTGRVDTRFNNISIAEAVGNSNYNGLNVTLNRRLSKGYEWFLSYTWSHALDDAPEQNVLDSGGNLPQDTTNRRADYGNSFSDRRHVLTFAGSLQPEFSISNKALSYLANHHQLSFILMARSGDPFNMGSNRVLNGDTNVPAAQQRPLFIGRNTLRGPKIAQLDMRYARSLFKYEQFTVDFLGEFINLLNHTNINGLNTTATVDATGAITAQPSFAPSALDSRQIQLGFRVRF
ncbi:MAG: TonB-dependent receptor [Acidobacteria bacterium]|nr:TonB-dependent receptor [Acidobacteriota bacterium]MBI3427069.1 TonB-dependent receptor [Acidobacteriota bacterium]